MSRPKKHSGTEIVPKQNTLPVIQSQPVKMDLAVNPENLIMAGINKGLSVENMKELLTMRRELKAEAAKEAFDEAMAAFQGECPIIKKTKPGAKTNAGVVAYYYAPLDAIVEQTKAIIQQHGFSYSIQTKTLVNDVEVTCTVKHSAGHSEASTVQIPLGDKNSLISNSQVVAIALSFAKRYAFSNAFGILTGDEDIDGAKLDEGKKQAKQQQAPGKAAQPAAQTRAPDNAAPVNEKDRTTNGNNLDRVLKYMNLSKQQMDSLINDANKHTAAEYEKILKKVIKWFIDKETTEGRFNDEKFINSVYVELDSYSVIDMTLDRAILALDSMVNYFKNKKEAAK